MMDEKEYWSKLEYRLGDEFGGIPDKRFSRLWCDGIMPEIYLLRDRPPKILGHAWIVDGQNQTEWKFELFLTRNFISREEIDWESLFPPLNMTKWLAVNWDKQIIQIEPAAAVPDLE